MALIETTETPEDIERLLEKAHAQLKAFEDAVDGKRLLARVKRSRPGNPVLVLRAVFVASGFFFLALMAGVIVTGLFHRPSAQFLAGLDEKMGFPLPLICMVLAFAMFVAYIMATFAAQSIGKETPMLQWEAKEYQKLVNEVTRLTTQKAVMERIRGTPNGARPRIATPVPMSMRGKSPQSAGFGGGFGNRPGSQSGFGGGEQQPSYLESAPSATDAFGGGAAAFGSSNASSSGFGDSGFGDSGFGGSSGGFGSSDLGNGGFGNEKPGFGERPSFAGFGDPAPSAPSFGESPSLLSRARSTSPSFNDHEPDSTSSPGYVEFDEPSPSRFGGTGGRSAFEDDAPAFGARKNAWESPDFGSSANFSSGKDHTSDPYPEPDFSSMTFDNDFTQAPTARFTDDDDDAFSGAADFASAPMGAPTRGGTPLGARPRAGISLGRVGLQAPASFPGTPEPTRRRSVEPEGDAPARVGIQMAKARPPTPAIAQPMLDIGDIEERTAPGAIVEDASVGGEDVPRWGRIDELWLEEAIEKAEKMMAGFPEQARLAFSVEEHLPFTLIIERATPAMAVRAMVSYVEFLASIYTPQHARIELRKVAHLDRSFHRNVDAALQPYFAGKVVVENNGGQVDIHFQDPDPSWDAYPMLPIL